MGASAAFSFANIILTYFSPIKSPFYAVIVFGTVALILTESISDPYWIYILAPIYIILCICTILSFSNKPNYTPEEYNGHLRFARSFGISVGVLCLVYFGRVLWKDTGTDHIHTFDLWAIWFGYVPPLLQSVLFLFYSYAYEPVEVAPKKVNFIQLSLITSTLLIGMTYSVTELEPTNPSSHYSTILILLSILWFGCFAYWLKHLSKVIQFRVLVPEDALLPTDAAGKPEDKIQAKG